VPPQTDTAAVPPRRRCGGSCRRSAARAIAAFDALEIETLEAVRAISTDETRPRVKVRVQQREAPLGVMRLVHKQLDDRSGGRFDGEIRKPDQLLGQLKGQGQRVTGGERGLPGVVSSRHGRVRAGGGEAGALLQIEVEEPLGRHPPVEELRPLASLHCLRQRARRSLRLKDQQFRLIRRAVAVEGITAQHLPCGRSGTS
jgi:hypothetical protein